MNTGMFIEFAWNEERKISLNPYEIVAVYPFDSKTTRICYGSHNYYEVVESYETVIQKINEFMEL